MFGVFYYRSANPRRSTQLSQFLPVPVEALAAEFAAGATPVDVCARTLRAMMDVGVRHFYISNLPLLGASATLNAILERVGAWRSAGLKVRDRMPSDRRLHGSAAHEKPSLDQGPSHPSDAHPLPVRLPHRRLGVRRGRRDVAERAT